MYNGRHGMGQDENASLPLGAPISRDSLNLEIPFDEVLKATGGFDAGHCLGEGMQGSVFAGLLADGTEVAVKRLSVEVTSEEAFETEVSIGARCRHPNLVILIGFARSGPVRCLVYEKLAGGDVGARLFGKQKPTLSAQHRVDVLLDVACGLSCLHHSTPKVFHRDIKSANILLDRHGTAKVADFGLSCLARRGPGGVAVEKISGTVGYADPKYIESAIVTESTEAYSFGMVVLEILTGRPAAVQDPRQPSGFDYLVAHCQGGTSSVMGMLDQVVQWPPHLATPLAALALRCIDAEDGVRPLFPEMVAELRGLQKIAAAPGTQFMRPMHASPPARMARNTRTGFRTPGPSRVCPQVSPGRSISPSRHPMGASRHGSPGPAVGPATGAACGSLAMNRVSRLNQPAPMLSASARSPTPSSLTARSPTPSALTARSPTPSARSPTPIYVERPEANPANQASNHAIMMSAPRWATQILADAMSQVPDRVECRSTGTDTVRTPTPSGQRPAQCRRSSPANWAAPVHGEPPAIPSGNRIYGAPRPLLPQGIRNVSPQADYGSAEPASGGVSLTSRSPSPTAASRMRESLSTPGRSQPRPQGALSPGRSPPRPLPYSSPRPVPQVGSHSRGTPCEGRTPSPDPWNGHSTGGMGISFADALRESPSPQRRPNAGCQSVAITFPDSVPRSLSSCQKETNCHSSARRLCQMPNTAGRDSSPGRRALQLGFRWDQPQHGDVEEEPEFDSDLAQAFAASEETYTADVRKRQQREEAELAAAMQASLEAVKTLQMPVGSEHQQVQPRLRFEGPQE